VKFYTPEKIVLMDITMLKKHRDGLVIEGKIMGAMPMKAILTPRELRSAVHLLTGPILFTAIGMLFRRSAK
jgi:hypothetical protein